MNTYKQYLRNETITFARKIFLVPSPYRNICIKFLAQYITCGKAPAGSLIDRLRLYGVSPARAMLGLPDARPTAGPDICRMEDGMVDSLRFLINSPHYRSRNSLEYKLVALLTRAF